MHFKITDTSQYAKSIFAKNHNVSIKIHSVYNKTINLALGKDLLSIQSIGSPLSPISLIVDANKEMLAMLNISTSSTAILLDDALQIDQHIFSFSQAFFHDLTPQSLLDSCSLQNIYCKSFSIISSSHSGGFDVFFQNMSIDPAPMWLKIARDHMNHCKYSIQSRDFSGGARTLRNLIGLGIGLTPSGDDFLCGVLAALCFLSQYQEATIFAKSVTVEIQNHLQDTNDISAAFLTSALHHNFSLAVNQLTSTFSEAQLYNAFTSIGHSSGIDSLCGIYYILDCFKDVWSA